VKRSQRFSAAFEMTAPSTHHAELLIGPAVIGLGRGLDLPITAEGERDDEAALLGKRNKPTGRH
jgi:hypothetical protein